jgi:DNA-3-methyladenine glycosylase I
MLFFNDSTLFEFLLTAPCDAIRKDLKKRGFTFVGSTVIHAQMQATGMVNNNKTSCFRYKDV